MAPIQLRWLLVSVISISTLSLASPLAEDVKALEERNILVPGYLVPAGTVANVGSDPQTTWPLRVPTSAVTLSTAAAKRDVVDMPDLVPTSTVNLATDTHAGTFTGTPLFMPTTVVKIGSTPGCSVWMSRYFFGTSAIETGYSYVTSCAGTATASAIASTTEVPDCCGGEDSIYPCNSDGSMPTGTTRWICTLGSSTCAGVATATTTWA